MRIVARIVIWTLTSAVALVCLAAASVFVLTQTAVGHTIVKKIALHVMHGPVHGQVYIGRISGNLFHGIAIDSVVIADSAGTPFVSAHHVSVRYDWHDFLHQRLDFNHVRLEHPVVVLSKDSSGVWNFARIFPSNPNSPKSNTPGWGSWIALRDVRVTDADVTAPPISSAHVRDLAGTVSITDSAQRYTIQQLNVTSGDTMVSGSADIEKLSEGTPAGHAALSITQRQRQMTATISGSLKNLQIHTALTMDNGGTLKADGTIDVSANDIAALKRGMTYDVTLATHDLNLSDFVVSLPRTNLNTSATISGRGLIPATMQAQLRADASTSVYDTLRVDSAHVRAAIANGTVTIDSSYVHAFATAADISGSLGLDTKHSGALQYQVVTDSLGKALHRDSVAGHVAVAGTISGSTKHFQLSGTLEAAHLTGFGATVNSAHAQYTWAGGPALTSPLEVTLNIDSAGYSNIGVDTLSLHLQYHQPDGQLELSAYRPGHHLVGTTITFAFAPKVNEVRYSTFTLRADTLEWQATRAGRVAWGTQGVVADSVDLRSMHTSSHIFLNGALPLGAAADQQAHFDIVVDSVSLAEVGSLLQRSFPISAEISAHATLSGTQDSPKVQGNAEITKATYDRTTLPRVQFAFQYDTTWLSAHAQMDRSSILDTIITRHDSAMGAMLSSQPMLVATAGVPINLALHATGDRLLNRPMFADMNSDTLPLQLLPVFFSQVSAAQGSTHIHVQVRGTPQAPLVTGGIVLHDGLFQLVPNGITLSQVATNIRLLGDTIIVDSLVARSRGWLKLHGLLDLSDPSVPVFNLTMAAHKARVLNTKEDGVLDIDDSLTAAGPLSVPYVSGTVTVRDGVLYIPDVGAKTVLGVDASDVVNVADTADPRVQRLVTRPSPILKNMRMDVDVSINQNTWVRNQAANLEVYTDAPLTVRMNPDQQAIVVDGVANTDRGQYTFLTKRFEITTGTVVFIGTPELNPTVQATGRYTTSMPGRQPLNILVLIGGTMREPTLTLSSDAEPPLSQTDLFTMLAFGSPASQLSVGGSGSGGSSAGGASGSGVSATNLAGSLGPYVAQRIGGVAVGTMTQELQTGLAHSLGADVLNITPAPGVPTDVSPSGLTGYLRNTELEFGKYFTPQTYIGLDVTPIAPPGASIEHQLSRRTTLTLSLQPWYLADPTLSPTSNITTKDVLGVALTKQWKF